MSSDCFVFYDLDDVTFPRGGENGKVIQAKRQVYQTNYELCYVIRHLQLDSQLLQTGEIRCEFEEA